MRIEQRQDDEYFKREKRKLIPMQLWQREISASTVVQFQKTHKNKVGKDKTTKNTMKTRILSLALTAAQAGFN